MANFIQKFENQSAYDADDTKQYPNTSLVGTDIVFAMAAPTPAFGGLTVKYNIEDPTQEVTLFNGGGGSSTSSSSGESGGGGDFGGGASSGSSESSSESGGGGALPTTMIVDGVSETPINTWRFETTGEHIVQYTFADNIVPYQFIKSLTNVTEVIVGDDITGISMYSFAYNSITSATIGSGITSIGELAFTNDVNLTSVTIKALDPPVLGSSAFSTLDNYQIYVPASAVDTYKNSTSTGWSEYASRIFAIQ